MQEDDDSLFASLSYSANGPTPRKFESWHQPRKQWVRRAQWRRLILRLLAMDEMHDGPLRYLGLPGDDLLDLRYIHREACEPSGRGFRFLGFNSSVVGSSSGRVSLEVSLDEVKRLSAVDSRSSVLPDDIRHLGRSSSQAWSRTCELGPYDIINWDLCDGLGRAEPTGEDTYYSALQNLFGLQSMRKEPWLLFVTTRVGPSQFSDVVKSAMLKRIEDNAANCATFAESLQEHLNGSLGELEQHWQRDATHAFMSIVGVSKWLISLGVSNRMKVKTEDVASYFVQAGSPTEDLVSVAYLCTPVVSASADPLGLANAVPMQIDECQFATRALKKAVSRTNVDILLESDHLLLDQLATEKADLMVTARFDRDEYLAWVTDLRSK